MAYELRDVRSLPLCETYRFRCIAPDRRGFGQSDWNGPDQGGKSITLETFADDVTLLLKSLKLESFILVGASMGCSEALLAFDKSKFFKDCCKVTSSFTTDLVATY